MFCENCGQKLTEGQRFCENCGAPVSASQTEPVQNPYPSQDIPENGYESGETMVLGGAAEPRQTLPIDDYESGETMVLDNIESPQPQQPYAQPQQPYAQPQQAYAQPQQPYAQPQQAYAQPQQYGYQPAEPQKDPGKKKKVIIGAAIAAAVVLIGVLAVILFTSGLFGSPKDRMHALEKKAVHQALSDIKANRTEGGALEVGVEPGQYLIDLAKGQNIDISWLKNAKIKMSAGTKDGVSAEKILLSLNDTELAVLNMLMDSSSNSMLIGLDSPLSESYGKMDLNALASMGSANLDLDKASSLIEKYLALTVDSIEDVKQGSEELTANGVTEKCTAYTATVTKKQAIMIAEKIVTTALSDTELKALLEDVYPMLTSGESFEEFYEDFQGTLNDTLEDLNEQKAEATDDALFTLTEYASKNSLTGIRIVFGADGDQSTVFAAVAHKGNDFGVQWTVNEGNLLLGSGTKKGNTVNGEVQLIVDEAPFANIKIINFDTKNYKGTCEIALTSDGWSLISNNSSIAPVLSAATLKLDYAKGSLIVEATISGQPVFKATLSSAAADQLSFDTNLPTVEMSEWPQTIDFNELLNRLKSAGVPEELLQSLFSSVMGAVS